MKIIELLHSNLVILAFVALTGTAHLSALNAIPAESDTPGGAHHRVVQTWEIDRVPAEFPVGFSLLTSSDRQYVAYYNAERQMTIASRNLEADTWQYHPLPSHIGWDSHNSIKLALDEDGHLHVSGNMHVDPLVYYRTEVAGDITSLKQSSMTGELEDRVTYPMFFKDHEGKLIFGYRHGSSGNGIRIYNKYDTQSRTWSRLLDAPLFDGEGQRNAYPTGPERGPDGWFHIVWVWRHTPDCATNHHLSHVRSKDLIHWESARGEAIDLPIRFSHSSLVVDPIPSGGGIINGCERLFFDSSNRPIISYHKSDADGNMQIYASRFEHGRWLAYKLTDWDKPVHFSGGGSMGTRVGISISGLLRHEPGVLTMTYSHKDYGKGRLVIDEETLNAIDRKIHISAPYPKAISTLESTFPGMFVRQAEDTGNPPEAGVTYILKWETLDTNRDRPRPPPFPEPSTLRLYKLSNIN